MEQVNRRSGTFKKDALAISQNQAKNYPLLLCACHESVGKFMTLIASNFKKTQQSSTGDP